MDDEHRIAPRRRVLKAASIEFGGDAIDSQSATSPIRGRRSKW
jgi:hypothetical protein